MAQNPNQNKIKTLEEKIKTAYSENRLPDVKTLAAEIRVLDPQNHLALRLLEKIQDKEAEANRAAHAEEINRLQDQITQAFKKAQFDELQRLNEALLKIDPKNKVVQKYKTKVSEAQEALAKKQAKAAQPKSPGLFARFITWMHSRRARAGKAIVKWPAPTLLKPPSIPLSIQSKIQEAAAQVDQKPAIPIHLAAASKVATPPPVPMVPKVAVAPMVTKPAITPAAIPQKPIQKPVIPAAPSGNIFTRMFGEQEAIKPAPKKSIIDTIVSKTEKPVNGVAAHPAKPKDTSGASFLHFTSAILQFSVVFMVLSAGFFYVQNIDRENRVLSLFGIEENYASRLHRASARLEAQKEQEKEINREIKRYEQGYNNRYEETIEQIVESRLKWPDILAKINEITNTIYEHNELSQYIQYSSFSFDAEKGLVTVSGSLTDPLGKNLTKLAEVEEAFRYYPKDSENPEDKTEPYFSDVKELNSLSKSFDKRTGRYSSSFQLSFALNPNRHD